MKINNFTKNKDYLVCISDIRCVLDTLTDKHMQCFGPCLINEWNLEKWDSDILSRWNHLNLYSNMRGADRFETLLALLIDVDAEFIKVEGLGAYEYWVETTMHRSNDSLKVEMTRSKSPIFNKVLHWSEMSDKLMTELDDSKSKLFKGVQDALAYTHQYADIVILTDSREETYSQSLTAFGLSDYIDGFISTGTSEKASSIQELLKNGYGISQVLVVGDTVFDMKATQRNGVFFYPILVNHEEDSWKDLMDAAVPRLLNNDYVGPYQRYKIDEFTKNFTK